MEFRELRELPMAMNVNITAERNTDADAPVRKAKNHKQESTRTSLIILDRFINGILAKIHKREK